jgi:hypothetical protein
VDTCCRGFENGHSVMASQRYLEWRRYCGLAMELNDATPRGCTYTNTHNCSLEELFEMSKPGELFSY